MFHFQQMVYVGYPITIATALSIFGFSRDENNRAALNYHLAKHGLGLYFYDKGIYILGVHVSMLMGNRDSYMSVDKGVDSILAHKKMVSESLAESGANLAEFDIQIMEGDAKRVYNPPPYLIS